MTTFPLIDCCEMLAIDPKTLRHWLRQATLPLHAHPSDARVKCLTMEQVQSLAALHGRALKPHPSLPSASGASASICGQPKPLTSPASLSEADLQQKLAALEAQVTLLHQQLAHLTSVLLLVQQTSVGHPQISLTALVPPTGAQRPYSAELPQQEGISQAEAGPRPHPAESRQRHPAGATADRRPERVAVDDLSLDTRPHRSLPRLRVQRALGLERARARRGDPVLAVLDPG